MNLLSILPCFVPLAFSLAVSHANSSSNGTNFIEPCDSPRIDPIPNVTIVYTTPSGERFDLEYPWQPEHDRRPTRRNVAKILSQYLYL